MLTQRTYRCPVCKKPLTKKEYERALHIHEAQAKHVKEREKQLAEDRRKFNADKVKIKKEAREAERKRSERTKKGLLSQVQQLREKVRALKRGKTQQEFGPEFEAKLLKQLRGEFPSDDIQRTKGGRGGDILHLVKEGKGDAAIIYECKWTPRIQRNHIQQAAQAKMTRRAQFAVLVTSGTRRGFNGLDEELNVIIVGPGGVLALAGLLRQHLVEMIRAGIEKKRRTKIANQLLRFIKSPEFKNPIEEVVRTADELKSGISDEMEWHRSNWEKRWKSYSRIQWDGRAIQENVRRVFHGEVPKHLSEPKERLALPAATS